MAWLVKKQDQFEGKSAETKKNRLIRRLIRQVKNAKNPHVRKFAKRELMEKYGIKVYGPREIKRYENQNH